MPLVALGLISDTSYVKKLVKSLSARSDAARAQFNLALQTEENKNRALKVLGPAPEKNGINIIDFTKIFKSNPFVDKTLSHLKELIKNDKKLAIRPKK